jgi:hypothetical protein
MTVLEAPVRRGPTDLTARWFLFGQTRTARWFWLIAVVVAVGYVSALALLSDRTAPGQVTSSVVGYMWQATMWVPFAVFIGLSLVYLPVHVAAGLTRRTLSHGALVAAAGTAALYGGVFAALFLAERAVYGVLGWTWQFADLSPDSATVVAFVVAMAVMFLLAYVSALLVAMVYQRGGGWWGTLTLPLTVGPIVALSGAIGYGGARFDDVPGLLGASALGLVLAAAMALCFHLLVRGARVPPKR